jgi:hypothetical protein
VLEEEKGELSALFCLLTLIESDGKEYIIVRFLEKSAE